MRGFNGGDTDPFSVRALTLFEACGSLVGQAYCLRTMGFKIGAHKPDLLERSIALFEQTGNELEAERGRRFLEVALMPDDREDDQPPISQEDFELLSKMWASCDCDDDD
jgi:hypothetical protein